jgi:hypothetical protein
MTPQFHRLAIEELMEGAYFAPTYGNTLMGLATHKPFDPADNYAIIYYPPSPRAMIEVVDPDEPSKVVDYGQTGRVRLTDKGILHAAFPGARRMRARTAMREIPLGRRAQRKTILALPEDGRRRRLLKTMKERTKKRSARKLFLFFFSRASFLRG